MVRKGLSPVVQQALDAVRVVGNEAVHPGALDLRDDRDTAGRLFELVNIIAEQMISNPKHVRELYKKLPSPNGKPLKSATQRQNQVHNSQVIGRYGRVKSDSPTKNI